MWTYTWEHGRELAAMSNGNTTWTNTYNADGLRTQRTNGTTTYSYVYNGSSLSQMTVGSHILYFAYDVSGTPMSVTYSGTTYYYATNLQGDVTAILNTSGTAVVTYTYDAWGNILTTTGTMAETLGAVNPLRYRGYVYDTETRFYYLQSRYYDPEIGRFINADSYASTGQGVLGCNMFAYCNNNPVNYHDSNGKALLPVAFELLEQWIWGDGVKQYYDAESEVSQKIKKSDTMKEKIDEAIEKYKNGEEYAHGTVIFESDEPDLWLGIRRASYELTITEEKKETGWWIFKKTETVYIVQVTVTDTYDFNTGNETGDGLGSVLNNLGFWAQEQGLGKKYEWEAQFVYSTKGN